MWIWQESSSFELIRVYKLFNTVSSFAIGARHIRLNFSYKHPQPLGGAGKEVTYGEVSPHKCVPALPYALSETGWDYSYVRQCFFYIRDQLGGRDEPQAGVNNGRSV